MIERRMEVGNIWSQRRHGSPRKSCRLCRSAVMFVGDVVANFTRYRYFEIQIACRFNVVSMSSWRGSVLWWKNSTERWGWKFRAAQFYGCPVTKKWSFFQRKTKGNLMPVGFFLYDPIEIVLSRWSHYNLEKNWNKVILVYCLSYDMLKKFITIKIILLGFSVFKRNLLCRL